MRKYPRNWCPICDIQFPMEREYRDSNATKQFGDHMATHCYEVKSSFNLRILCWCGSQFLNRKGRKGKRVMTAFEWLGRHLNHIPDIVDHIAISRWRALHAGTVSTQEGIFPPNPIGGIHKRGSQ